MNDFYTKEQIDSMLQDSDLSNYYTKAEVNYLIPTDYIKSIPSEYITESELNAKGYLTEHQDLSKYALKTDIPTDYIKSIPSEYVTENELNNKGYLTQHQSLEEIEWEEFGNGYYFTSISFADCVKLGTNDGREMFRQTFIDRSYDRASAGLPTCTITLSCNTKSVLSQTAIAQMTKKGFTIA